ANFQDMLAETAKHIAFVASEALKNDLRTLEPEAQAEADWVKSIVRMSNFRAPFLKECTPGYYNNEGQPDEVTAKNGSYLKGPNAFVRLLEGWRAEGTMRGLEVTR
ncbi:MAG TPA: monooxygenase, partial [Rhodoblastus sp.]|nr:monooxygenase [Rhodoblastus sp.]